MNDALHKKGKELIAMGESICAMAGSGDDDKEDYSSGDDDSMTSESTDDKEAKKKMSIAMLSKKFGSM